MDWSQNRCEAYSSDETGGKLQNITNIMAYGIMPVPPPRYKL